MLDLMNYFKNIILPLSVILYFSACKKASHKEVMVKSVTPSPIIDGKVDNTWNSSEWLPLNNVRWTTLEKVTKEDISAAYKILWDKENLYFLVNVTDDVKFQNTFTTEFEKKYDLRLRENDGVELFFDPKNIKFSGIDVSNFNYKKFTYDTDSISTSTSTPINSVVEGIICAQSDTKSGYMFEIKFPWKALDIKPKEGLKIGFEMNVIDNDNDVPKPEMLSEKEAILTWNNDTYKNPFNSTDIYGTLILK